jgi:hypothetical protein
VGGLLIVAGILAAATPARADIWKNLHDETKCMGVSGGTMTSGTKIIIWDCDGHPDQNWGLYYTGYGNYSQIYDHATPSPEDPASECIALPRAQTADGTYFIIWNCTSFTDDQKWFPFYVTTDSNGHNCYSFENLLANERGQGTMVPSPYLNEVQDGQLVVLEQWHGWDTQTWCSY